MREKDAGKDLERMVIRKVHGRAFRLQGPVLAKDLVWPKMVWLDYLQGNKKNTSVQRRRSRREAAERWVRMWTLRYFGATLSFDLRTKTKILNCIRVQRGSQCNWLTINEEIWPDLRRWTINLAAALRTDWIEVNRILGRHKKRNALVNSMGGDLGDWGTPQTRCQVSAYGQFYNYE